MKYFLIRLKPGDNDPTGTPIVYLIRDDGYRWYVRAISHPAQNLIDAGEDCFIEYKHFNFPGVASDIIDFLLSKMEECDDLDLIINTACNSINKPFKKFLFKNGVIDAAGTIQTHEFAGMPVPRGDEIADMCCYCHRPKYGANHFS